MSIPNTLILPFPPPSLLVTMSSVSKSVSLFLFYKQGHLYHFLLGCAYKGCHTVFLFLCLTSLSMTISKCIYVAANGMISFFSMAGWYCIIYTYHVFFIHSSLGGHLVCFHILATVISAAMNRKSHFSLASLLQPGNPVRWCWTLIQSQKGFLYHLQCVPPPVSSETSCSPTRPPLSPSFS